jgi:hypothetical protein
MNRGHRDQPIHTRRDFLRAAVLTTGSLSMSRRLATVEASVIRAVPFEVSASLYAWELHDEGIETILDNLQEMAAVNSVYLIALMHYEKRPLTSPIFPHNPVRKTWQAEDSRIYWHPDLKRYGRIRPRLSDYDWLSQTDWLKILVQAVRKRGLKTGVEISHTVLDAERGKNEFLDCVQRDIHGAPRAIYGRGYPICLNNPDARQYVLALASDLAANYDVDYLQTCMIPFMPGGPDKGGCFCDSCRRAAQEAGFDLGKAKAILQANPKAQPELDQWQAFRRHSATQFYRAMHERVHAIRQDIDLRFNDCFRNAGDWGLDLGRLKAHLDSVRVCDYTEQQGDPARMKGKRQWLTDERRVLGKDFRLLSAVAVRPKATPELIRTGVKIAVECGVDGITLGHYDGSEFPMLRAVREGLTAAHVEVSAPADKR